MKFNPWPVVITIVCTAAFAAAATVVVVMVSKRVELVTPDYYAHDQRHGERMEQEIRAKSLSTPVTITYEKQTSSIDIQFPEKDISGTVTLYRPSDLTMDKTMEISIDENRRQQIPTTGIADGLWRVRLQWNHDGADYYQENIITTL